ncbi:hypothetical protein HK096_005748 [Nowakowskiella sp. JEL0078]|nr:hypothetical protein HK096_005748 [Nowakowskiella sp. JEL0078]
MSFLKVLFNSNSSRFSKVLKLQYNRNYRVDGAHIEIYGLDLSRLAGVNPGERNFHVFYELLQGTNSEERRKYELHSVGKYNCLRGGENMNLTDRKNFDRLKLAFIFLEFDTLEINSIFSILSAILLIGNLQCEESSAQKEIILLVAKLLLVDQQSIFSVLGTSEPRKFFKGSLKKEKVQLKFIHLKINR